MLLLPALQVNLALRGLPQFKCLPEDRGQHRTTTHLLPDEEHVLEAVTQVGGREAGKQLRGMGCSGAPWWLADSSLGWWQALVMSFLAPVQFQPHPSGRGSSPSRLPLPCGPPGL